MMKRALLILAVVFTAQAQAQESAKKAGEAYLIPFATAGNQIQLSVVNRGDLVAERVVVRAEDVPVWLDLDRPETAIMSITPGGEELATFSFSVDRGAPVRTMARISFGVFSVGGERIGSRVIELEVEAPKEMALDQNYPNPFNPSTTIGFDLPQDGGIDLRVYDILGREIVVLADGEHAAGHHEVKWDAGHLPSGTYFYVLKAREASGSQKVSRQKMLLVK